MISFRMLLCALTLMLLAADVDSSSSEEDITDLSGVSLRTLYNSPVFMAERMKRPLKWIPIILGPVSHSGVRVTLANRAQWLIHKGRNYGISSDTVVTDAGHMSSKWKVVDTADFEGRKTVSDFVADGGSDYGLIFKNCHLASRRMMRPQTN